MMNREQGTWNGNPEPSHRDPSVTSVPGMHPVSEPASPVSMPEFGHPIPLLPLAIHCKNRFGDGGVTAIVNEKF